MDGFKWLLLARSFAGVAAASWVAFTVLFPSYYKENKVHVAMSSISFVIVVIFWRNSFVLNFVNFAKNLKEMGINWAF